MDYKATLTLPKTDFPMKADLPKREPLMLPSWETIYSQLQERRRGQKQFVLHDGPPFANGDAHMGHALNMTLKDLVLKSKNMTGYDVPFIPGWDCHGLPIEHKVMKELGEKSPDPVVIREKCAAYARKYIDLQREQFKRLGVFGDWDHPYLTLDPGYEAEILRLFATLVEKGWVYRALRPVHWSTGCQTALAEAEIEYQAKTDLSVYVRFPLTAEGAKKLGLGEKASLLIWTTTPWTLPANLGVAAGAEMSYGIFEVNGEQVIASTILAPKLLNLAGVNPTRTLKGSELERVSYRHPFLDRTGLIYLADFVTAESGTGLVHIAPGHGQDDYQLGQKVGLKVLSPVDDRGCLTAECGVESLTGEYVFKANPKVRDLLRDKGMLWADETFSHDYPHCWRSKTPIIFRSVSQWFIQVNAFRGQALEAIDRVDWIPAWGKNRIRGAVETRPDWCISRQRTWGVPIPVFYQEDGTPLLDGGVIRKFADLVEKEGTDSWFKTESEALTEKLELPKGLKKGHDTLDVWIDSGSSHAAVVRKRLTFPADLYLEGSDQHRGWFQSSLLTSVAVNNGEPPYRQVLTNGFVVDMDGKKLSKSASYQKPMDLMSFVNKYGADILRLWVASQDYRDDVPFSEEIFTRVTDTYRTIRNTLRVLLGNLNGYTADQAVPESEWTSVDRYLYEKLQLLVQEVKASYEKYEFHQVYHAINRFCAVDLSALYVDVLKDRMYCDDVRSVQRRASQTVIYQVVDHLVRLLAPVMPFTSEETWLALGNKESIHLQLFPQEKPVDGALLAHWEKLLQLRSLANESLEKARQQKLIGKNIEAQATIVSPDFTEADRAVIEELLIVSKASFQKGETTSITVEVAEGKRCLRCWKSGSVGSSASHPELCERCTKVLG